VKRAFAAALLGGGGHVGRRRLEAPRRVDALPRARVTGRGGRPRGTARRRHRAVRARSWGRLRQPLYGGLLFAAWGLLALLAPGLAAPLEQGLPTGLPIPGLDSVNAGLILVAVIVFGIAAGSFVRAVRRVRSLFPAEPGG
jgi:hypothetical protein